ncbi:MAG TPA: hypothetical protein VMS64_07925 [Candidatus Methylomirabilis sp.]|nr:hypothetical protein [Candidatus Methylomirabilis sp.]
MRVIVASGALSAALALVMARLQFLLAADVLALGAALGGLAAFVVAAVSTIRRAGNLPSRPSPP